MAHVAKKFTINRCPKCFSSNFKVKLTVTSTQGYNVNNGLVEEILYSRMQISVNYKFVCKECGHEWEGDTFFTDFIKPE